jgi:hypothetical protein
MSSGSESGSSGGEVLVAAVAVAAEWLVTIFLIDLNSI